MKIAPPPLEARSNLAVIERLQATLRGTLRTLVPAGTDYVIADFPNHSNVGDSAIYVGEAIFFMEHFQRRPSLVTEAWEIDFEALRRHEWTGPVLLHGGGNFGDIWPRHQLFREKVIAHFRDRQIIQLPQSIHFESEANLARAAAAINAHPDFTLLVRDEKSLAIAKAAFTCPVLLAPDMAFMIGAFEPPKPPTCKVLCLLRQDKESNLKVGDSLDRLPRPSVVVDWPTEERRIRFARLPFGIRRHLPAALHGYRPQSPKAFEYLAWRRVIRGFELLAQGEVIVTDRLHAHILSLLLGKPHVTLDNFYGKIRNFANAWTNGANFVDALTLDEAVEKAAKLLKSDIP